MLPLALRGTHRAAHRAIQPAQLALGPRIHITHPAHYRVRLVVQIQTVADKFLQFDLGWALGPSPIAPTVIAAVSAIAALSAVLSASPRPPVFARRTLLPAALF